MVRFVFETNLSEKKRIVHVSILKKMKIKVCMKMVLWNCGGEKFNLRNSAVLKVFR